LRYFEGINRRILKALNTTQGQRSLLRWFSGFQLNGGTETQTAGGEEEEKLIPRTWTTVNNAPQEDGTEKIIRTGRDIRTIIIIIIIKCVIVLSKRGIREG